MLGVIALFTTQTLLGCGTQPTAEVSSPRPSAVTVASAKHNDAVVGPEPSVEGRLVVTFIDNMGASVQHIEHGMAPDGGHFRFPQDVDLSALVRCRQRALRDNPQEVGWYILQLKVGGADKLTGKGEIEGLSGSTARCIREAAKKLSGISRQYGPLWWVYVKFL